MGARRDGGIFALQQVVGPVVAAIASALGRRADGRLRSRVMAATLRPPGIGHLEDPAMLDQVSLAKGAGANDVSLAQAITAMVTVAGQRLSGVLSALVLVGFGWWLAAGLVAFNLGLVRVLAVDFRRQVVSFTARVQVFRASDYFRDLALAPIAAKETRVFGLGGWVAERFDAEWHRGMDPVRQDRRTGRSTGPLAAGVFLVFNAAVFYLLGRAGARGEISVGELVAYSSAVAGLGNMFTVQPDHLDIGLGTAAVPAALGLEAVTEGQSRSVPGTRPAHGLPARSIRFEGVSFTYPGQSKPVFDDLDLDIPSGRSLALVGQNGAGKTTLVKLLTRLYEPSQGRITADEVDIAELDPSAWQARFGAIFQDFVRYELSAADNVGLGALALSSDRDALGRAVRRAGAADVVEGLTAGWDTPLSRQYTGGAEPSGGQWQRLALARALLAVEGGASVLILDEPTANLDVRAEADLYDRFLDLTKGLTTVVISHRFSTVRRADHIVVLEEGQVREQGSHEDLMDAGGRYARMFRLQAARFTTPGRRSDATPGGGSGAGLGETGTNAGSGDLGNADGGRDGSDA